MKDITFISVHNTRGIITTQYPSDNTFEIFTGTENECAVKLDKIESKLDDYNTFHARQIRLEDITTHKQYLKYIEHES